MIIMRESMKEGEGEGEKDYLEKVGMKRSIIIGGGQI